jgi:hypothetical protein
VASLTGSRKISLFVDDEGPVARKVGEVDWRDEDLALRIAEREGVKKAPIDSPSRDVLAVVATRVPAETPEELESRIRKEYEDARARVIDLTDAIGSIDRDVRQADAAINARRGKIADAKSLIPAPPVLPDLEELLVAAGMGDDEAEAKIRRLKKEHAVLVRLAAEKTAKVMEDVKPLEGQLAALERHAGRLYKTRGSLQGEKKEAVIAFHEAELGVLDLRRSPLARQLEDKIFRQVNINDSSDGWAPTPWAQGFRDLLIPPIGRTPPS